jgi:hypothetical protein
MTNCSSLTSIYLDPLSNVTELQFGFLEDCSALQSLDLGAFSNLTTIESDFLTGCKAFGFPGGSWALGTSQRCLAVGMCCRLVAVGTGSS